MSATSHAHARALDPSLSKVDELELDCIVCHGVVASSEKVVYWPPTADRVGMIAHVRCLNDAGSL